MFQFSIDSQVKLEQEGAYFRVLYDNLMHLLNFKIANDNIAIETIEDGYLDLHNNFNLQSFHYDFTNRSLIISFIKANGDWVPVYAFNVFRLFFSGVDVLRVKGLDEESGAAYPQDDQTLDLIGFTDKNDTDFTGVLVNPNPLENALIITTQNE